MMARTATYGSTAIAYRLVRRPCRTLSITVTPDGAVRVTAPQDVDPAAVDARIARRGRWILRQQRRFAEFRPRTPARRYVGGETHRYLGRQYRLKIMRAAADRVALRSGRLVVETRFPKDRPWTRTLVQRWMRQRAHEVLKACYDAAAPVLKALGIKQPALMICPMKKRWGSHTRSGRVLLNDRLIAARRDCIEYVIVHELCHVVAADHSARFFRLLSRFVPDWGDRKERLERSAI